MNRLTALLDWIDNGAGALIRLAYLAAGVTAVAVYFGAGHLPGPVDAALNAGLPWALAFAVETHCYISARRVRAAWQDLQASAPTSVEHGRARAALRVNLGVLAGLLAFSAWNQLGYLASSGWTPGSAAFALPPLAAYAVRALVVPGAFMAAAFLAPLAEPITAQLENEARATLADVFKIARAQRKRLLKEAERSGRDMTGALVELVPDPDARRIIAHAYGAIRGEPVPVGTLPAGHFIQGLPPAPAGALPARAYDGAGVPAPADPRSEPSASPAAAQAPVGPRSAPHSATTDAQSDAQAAAEDAPDHAPDRPPTGGGTPARKRQGVRTRRKPARPAVLRLTPEPAEHRIRAVLEADSAASISKIARVAGVGKSTASKWREVWLAEHGTGRAAAVAGWPATAAAAVEPATEQIGKVAQ